jgi:Pre ATP-grasp domain/PGM1 C-terminal domain/ATP-grasp domain
MKSFEDLQRGLGEAHPGLRLFAPVPGTIVVLPSITLPAEVLRHLIGTRHYEERMLWILLTLADPATQVVYLSSDPIDPSIVDYYLDFLPDPDKARARLLMVDLGDRRPIPLTHKLLRRPDVIDRLRALVAERDGGWVQPFIVTSAERTFAEQVGLPLYGPHPSLGHLGSKSGARRAARAAGVPVPAGAEDLWSIRDVERAIGELPPTAARAVVKLNDSSSGLGNAVIELDADGGRIASSATRFTTEAESWSSFARKIAARGAVAEALLEHDGLVSPSVQVEITPGGTAHVLGTHVQVLGGSNGQTYLGCRFPADSSYRETIQRYAEQVAVVLAERGVLGSFGIDFLVVPGPTGDAEAYLAEINLRFGGTTHPLGMVTLTTQASYDRRAGQLIAQGRPKFYVATDNLVRERLIGTTPADCVVMLQKAGLALERGSGRGVTLHMLGALRDFGKVGFTCVGDSPREADELYAETLRLLRHWDPRRR